MEKRVEKLEFEMSEVRREAFEMKTRLAVAESNIKDIKEDLSSIKSNTTWIIRLVIGAIVLAVIGFTMNQGGLK